LLVGTLAILTLAGILGYRQPSPGALASAHARFEGALPTCSTCHAEDGLDAGCLSCHVEIAAQLEADAGYHHELCGDGEPDCARCHPEHHGATFDIMEAVAWPAGEFAHDHVEFKLDGSHADLDCGACHTARPTLPDFPDQPRTQSFLGLGQDCVGCHTDVHGGELFQACESCHDQEHFRPASGFDHAKHFALVGGHDRIECKGCHVLDEGLTFNRVRGKTCAECHATPHRTKWDATCTACHAAAEPEWTAGAAFVTPEVHARTGFTLDAPHEAVACDGCHRKDTGYAQRYASPPRASKDCAACHADAHGGQFGERGAQCLACHEPTHFAPARYGHEQHTTFALKDAHAKADCAACHARTDGVRQFVGTPRTCAGCHEDAHRGQFKAQSCDACHDERRFKPAHYGLKDHTSFKLEGAHDAVACTACHTVEKGRTDRRFVGTPRTCRECHADPHGAQFARETKKSGCAACHLPDASTFRITPFDHAKRTGYRLEGAHADVACNACHVKPGGKGERRFRDTPTQCRSCHTDNHRGQFGKRDCANCHRSNAAWSIPKFDHKSTRFPLDGAHIKVDCKKCHFPVKQRDGSMVTQYRPLGTECRSCHEFDKR
jgi:hypothetical protein